MLHRYRLLSPVAPAALALVLILGLCLSACSSGSKKAAAEAQQEKKAAAAVKATGLKLGAVTVQSAGPPVNVDSATRAAALAVAQKYVDTAVLSPLRDGTLGAGFDTVFDTGIRPFATAKDAPTLNDVTVGKLDGLTETATPVKLSGLADNTGTLVYLATNFVLNVKSNSPAIKIARNVELTLVPGADKHWSVGAYRVVVTRTTPARKTTTTTARSGGTTP